MRYDNIQKAIFLARPNRFIALVRLGDEEGRISHQSVDWVRNDGGETVAHVKNTGRCKELLVPGATVYLEQSQNPARKTAYDLVAVEKGSLLVNMDSQAPNKIFQEWAAAGRFRPDLTLLRPETTWGSSRFDFYWEDAAGKKGFVEVKGCTLEADGHARFPDAPTLRGVKHLDELVAAKAAGYEAAVCFVLQMAEMVDFAPNDDTHPEFGTALRRAKAAGVEVLAYGCRVAPGEVTMGTPVPVVL